MTTIRHPLAVPVGPTGPERRIAVSVAIVGVHALAVWGLLQLRDVREPAVAAAPLFVRTLAPVAPSAPPDVALAMPRPNRPPLPMPPVEPPRIVIDAPAQAPPAEPRAAAPAVPTPLTEAPAAPAPAPAPKIIPASAIEYLEPIVVEYPRLSRRLHETGRVMVRVYVDEAGLPRQVQIERSSGHPRLDVAALAAVQKVRFKPYTENGRPAAGWAYIPLDFDLET